MHALRTSEEIYSLIALPVSCGIGNSSRGRVLDEVDCSIASTFEGMDSGVGGSTTWNSGMMDRKTRKTTPQHLPSCHRMAWAQNRRSGSTMLDCIKQNFRSEGYFVGALVASRFERPSNGGSRCCDQQIVGSSVVNMAHLFLQDPGNLQP